MDTASDTDDFENALFHFVAAVNVMASDAPDQASAMGNFNAAWEIQHDVIEGAALLDHPVSYLDDRQRRAIDDLVSVARGLPKEALGGNAAVALNHPAWGPLRVRANDLLKSLSPAIAKNAEYFRGS